MNSAWRTALKIYWSQNSTKFLKRHARLLFRSKPTPKSNKKIKPTKQPFIVRDLKSYYMKKIGLQQSIQVKMVSPTKFLETPNAKTVLELLMRLTVTSTTSSKPELTKKNVMTMIWSLINSSFITNICWAWENSAALTVALKEELKYKSKGTCN